MSDTLAARRRATSYDVARAAGVAQSTVSRCFRDDGTISASTRSRVIEAADRLGYLPNTLARSLITQRSNMVGVVITQASLRSNPDVVYAIGESLRAAGKQLLLVTVAHDCPPPATLRGALEFPLDGLISCVTIADDDLSELLARHLPVVFYNRQAGRFPVDSVTADHANAAGALAARLHAAGHRRYLVVGGPPEAPVSRLRIQGFVERLTALGVTGTRILDTDYSYAGGRAAFLGFADAEARPDAVFCANDQIAMGVMDAARSDLGWSVPADLSVVGFDDVAEAARPTYELTTLHQENVDMAHHAVALLLTRIGSPGAETVHAVLPARFVQRGSARLAT